MRPVLYCSVCALGHDCVALSTKYQIIHKSQNDIRRMNARRKTELKEAQFVWLCVFYMSFDVVLKPKQNKKPKNHPGDRPGPRGHKNMVKPGRTSEAKEWDWKLCFFCICQIPKGLVVR